MAQSVGADFPNLNFRSRPVSDYPIILDLKERRFLRARTKLFNRSRLVVGFLPPWARTIHSFCWLHVLGSNDLNDITADSYQGQSGFETQEHNLQDLWTWEEAAFRQIFSHSKNILVAGAGGGREMIALSGMGIKVFGFDSSRDLVEACRHNLTQANVVAGIVWAPPGEAHCGPKLYDGLVIGRGVYHHIPGRIQRINFLKACRKQLKPGSPIFIGDFLTRRGERPLTAFALCRKVEPGDSIGTSFFHYFSGGDVCTELDDAGLELLDYRPTPFLGGASMAHVLARSKI